MNRQKILAPWQIALNALKEKSGMSYKQIGDALNVSEKSVSRLFTGEAKKPDFFFVSQVIRKLGGSVSEILGEGGAYIVSQDIITLQAQYDELKASYDRLLEESKTLADENAELLKKNLELASETGTLKVKLGLQEETISLYRIILNMTNKEKENAKG